MSQLFTPPGLDIPHPGDDGLHIAGDAEAPGLPRAYSEEDVGIALGLQLLHGGRGCVQPDLHAHFPHEGRVLLDGLVGNPEGGNHMTHHAAQGGLLLEEGGGNPGAGAEVSRRHTSGAAAHDGSLSAVRDRRGGLEGGQRLVTAALRCCQLGSANLNGTVVEIPGALIHAVVGADSSSNEGQGVLLQNDLQRLGIPALTAELDILGDVLADGAPALAGSGEAVEEGDLLIELSPGQGLDGLDMVFIAADGEGQGLYLLHVHAGKGLEFQRLQLFADLFEPLVAAGLQLGGCHSDGPDAALEELVDVEEVCAAGVAQAQAAIELPADPPGHFDGQGEQALARHVHFFAGQLAPLHIHREGVGELQTEFQAVLPRQGQQAAEHGNRIAVLQVLVKMMLIEGDIVVAHAVQNIPGRLVTQDGGVALDEGVQALLGDQIGGDALNLVRRTAVKGGDGNAVRDPGADGVDERRFGGEHFFQDTPALLENGFAGGVLHPGEILVNLRPSDALQVVAHGHVEDEAVGVPQTVDLS